MATHNEKSAASARPSEALKNIEKQLTCTICHEHFTNPKILPCCHSFCLNCLQHLPNELIEDKPALNCPICQTPCPHPDDGLGALPPSFVICNLSEVYDLMKNILHDQHAFCDICDKNKAHYKCKQCDVFLCPDCLHDHDNWKQNTAHLRLSLDVLANTVDQLPHQLEAADNIKCTVHNKPLMRFCETCQKLLCHQCMIKQHAGHDHIAVNESYKRHHDSMTRSHLQPLNQQISSLTQDRVNLINREKQITNQGEIAKSDIHHMMDEVRAIVDEMKRKLIEDVNFAMQHEVSVLDQQIDEVQMTLRKVRECRDNVDQTLKFGTPYQVLSMHHELMSRAERVISDHRDKKFQPTEQADIKVERSNEISELIKRLVRVTYTSSHLPMPPVSLSGEHFTIKIAFASAPESLSSSALVPSSQSLKSCHLIPPSNSTSPIPCSMKVSKLSGRYCVAFTPIATDDQDTFLTPVGIPIPAPLEMRNSPVNVISNLNAPSGVTIADNGLVIVNESGKNSITVLDKQGKRVRSFGFYGSERKEKDNPQGMAISSKGTVLVVNEGNGCIQEFTMDGECKNCVGTKGSAFFRNGPLRFYHPNDIAVNKTTGQVYVADTGNNQLQVLNSDLKFSHMFGKEGSGEAKVKHPLGVAVDKQGLVYVVNGENHCIQKFTPDGQFVSSFCTKKQDFQYPASIAVDDNGLLYITSSKGHHGSVYTTDGEYCYSINLKNTALKSSNDWPASRVAIDGDGYLYVCCQLDGQIQVF